jgi:hypothetical protein
MQVLFWSTAATLVVSAIASGVRNEALIPPDPSWFIWPLALAVVAHVMGQGLIVAGVGRTPAALGGLLLLIQPVTGATDRLAAVWRSADRGAAGWMHALFCCGVWLAGPGVDGQARPRYAFDRDQDCRKAMSDSQYAGPVRSAKRRHGCCRVCAASQALTVRPCRRTPAFFAMSPAPLALLWRHMTLPSLRLA